MNRAATVGQASCLSQTPHHSRLSGIGTCSGQIEGRRRQAGSLSCAVADMRDMDGINSAGALLSAQIIKNELGSGVSFHLRAPIEDGAHYFLRQNNYLDAAGSPMNLFSEPLALPVHYQP